MNRKRKEYIWDTPDRYTMLDNEKSICWIKLTNPNNQTVEDPGLNENVAYRVKEELNDWWEQDAKIRRFLSKDEPLGNTIFDEIEEIGNDVSLAVAIAKPQDMIDRRDSISNPANYLFDSHDSLYDDTDILGIILYALNGRGILDIKCITTSPHHRKEGVSTRMVSSFLHNTRFMVDDYQEIENVYTTIRDDNTPSKKCFLKNNFHVVPGSHHAFGKQYGTIHRVYKHELNKDEFSK